MSLPLTLFGQTPESHDLWRAALASIVFGLIGIALLMVGYVSAVPGRVLRRAGRRIAKPQAAQRKKTHVIKAKTGSSTGTVYRTM
jgi:hypothetical protein